ncbi:MAG: bactofilin family protein [Burkholderiales bacterium]
MQQKDRFWTRNDAPVRPDLKPATPVIPASPSAAGAPRRPADALATPSPEPKPGSVPVSTEGSKLIVGPGIQLKGVEIKDCDTLIVEGHVEASMDSRAIEIAAAGSYAGNAGIDVAEIHGQFSGEITVRKCLTIRATGKVSGKIRYLKLVIEEGGELMGDIQTLAAEGPATKAAGAVATPPVPRNPSAAHPLQ